MQTKPIDALRLWWREVHFTNNQRKALAAIAVIAVSISAFYIFKPNQAEANAPKPTIIKPAMLVVDVAGEVTKPGVYELALNSRVIDALKAAGGAKPEADLSLVNLARVIKDGEQIYIDKKISGITYRSYSQKSYGKSSGNGSSSRLIPAILNINRASAKELEYLPGIGPVLAERIVEFRKVNGSFVSVEELEKVPGIGASKLAKFKEKIRV
jgi:competence protein ComEA